MYANKQKSIELWTIFNTNVIRNLISDEYLHWIDLCWIYAHIRESIHNTQHLWTSGCEKGK